MGWMQPQFNAAQLFYGNYVNVPSDFSTPFLLSIGDDESEVDCPIMGEARWATATPAIS
jgi:hypothetical protein